MAEDIVWLGEKTDTTDKASLCESKHRVNVGIVKIDGKIIPFESYIVVSFEAMDTEGGVIGGLMTEAGCMWNNFAYIVTANKYVQDVGHGLADWSRDRGVVYGEGVEGGTAKFVNEGLFNMGGNVGKIWEKSPTIKKVKKSKYNPVNWFAETDYSFYAEQEKQSSPFYTPKGFATEATNTAGSGPCEFQGFGSFWGTDFHPENADKHKVMITIENEFEGVKSTVFKGPLAACMMMVSGDECIKCCNMKSFNRYFVTQPGKWTVKAKAVGSGICAKPTYNFEWSFDVPKPDNWDEMVAVNPIQTMSQNISAQLQEAGIPFYVSPLAIVGTASLVGGFLLFKLYKKKKG